MPVKESLLTQDYIKKLFKYNPETGDLLWRIQKGTQGIIGNVTGCTDDRGRILIKINSKRYYAHRLVFLYHHGYFPEYEIDHIDRNPSNNRISNLREVSHICNMRNAKRDRTNTSGITGVYQVKGDGKWRAAITINRKIYHLKFTSSFKDTVIARHNAEIKYNWPGCNDRTDAARYVAKLAG
jgi:hypothetical protein